MLLGHGLYAARSRLVCCYTPCLHAASARLRPQAQARLRSKKNHKKAGKKEQKKKEKEKKGEKEEKRTHAVDSRDADSLDEAAVGFDALPLLRLCTPPRVTPHPPTLFPVLVFFSSARARGKSTCRAVEGCELKRGDVGLGGEEEGLGVAGVGDEEVWRAQLLAETMVRCRRKGESEEEGERARRKERGRGGREEGRVRRERGGGGGRARE
eukprot:2238969-Rhodomonas_salina.1